ncbi:MAG: 1-acyl-sn-glycerol-3-phosphate acyltransferase [Treponema sp.]|nr:1-acyl-sn-glycerol-3-phosphate acyltransferase [Treponema sp.]
MAKSKAEKEEIKQKYNHDDLPKIKNIFIYPYFCFMKLFCYAFFGVGAVILAVLVFPFFHIFIHDKKKFGITARSYVSHTFRFFINMMRVTGVIRLKNDDLEAMKNLRGKVIIANHPSILDFVFIMSFVPTATCIVRGSLLKTPVGGVIRQAYITNTTDFDEMCARCKELLELGCNVIIFPEGTRSPRHGRNSYKKGAARIALKTGANVQPVFIGGSDKYCLGKHDPWWSYNHVERLLYHFQLLSEIDVSQYKDLSEPIAAKHLTEKMEEVIRGAGDAYSQNHPLCKTLNTY